MNLKERYIQQKNVILSMAFLLFGIAAFFYIAPLTVTTSTNVSGRNLPIYCVETTDPKVALSFDAAWGNEDTREILAILKKHDVRVTFFMTCLSKYIVRFSQHFLRFS